MAVCKRKKRKKAEETKVKKSEDRDTEGLKILSKSKVKKQRKKDMYWERRRKN